MARLLKSLPAAGACALLMFVSCGGSGAEEQDGTVPADSIPADAGPASVHGTELQFMYAAHIFIERDGADADGTASGMDDREARMMMESIQDMLASGEADFETLAREYSRCPSSSDGGRLPAFTEGAVAWPLDSAVAELAPGEVSGIVRTRFGYHLVKRLDI
ncbi:MAG: peptidylprolyl isomerase [Candidatus Aegiribacteria sp.]